MTSRRAWLATAGLAAAAAATILTARSLADVTLPPPVEAPPPPPNPGDFVGAERCVSCHAPQFAAWSNSTHALAGGAPSPRLVLAPFAGPPLQLADGRVTPRVRGGAYEFLVEQPGEPDRVFRVDGVVGGAHIYGGGTQAFVTRLGGTLRVLPFEWSRQARGWFCNTNSRAGRGWALITSATRLADCGDWPPARVIGDLPRFANCQSCHASQALVTLDNAAGGYVTTATSLAINCESCHGPAREHVEIAERGALEAATGAGMAALATLDKDASIGVCFQCHAMKDQVAPGFVSGRPLESFYSLKFPLLGDRPLHPDGRARTFAYQEGHVYSACFFAGGMTCVSCHDPHSQGYRSATGEPLVGRFDDRQCLACHASKTADIPAHTRHRAGSAGSKCVACHMPSRQQPDTRGADPRATVVQYARSDHTISIPRPALDSALGMPSACTVCHADWSTGTLQRQVRAWWGEPKPRPAQLSAQLRYREGGAVADAARQLLPAPGAGPHAFATFAGLARFLESHVRVDVALDAAVADRLWRLADDSDVDVAAAALASLHLSAGNERPTRRRLARALRAAGDSDAGLRTRWALALAFKADQSAGRRAYAAAIAAYRRALEVRPADARLLVSLGNAQRAAGDGEGAAAWYRQSLAVDAAAPLAWVNLGITLAGQADTAGALGALTRAATLDAAEPLAWFNLANIAFVRGDLSRAASLYIRTVEADASITPAQFQLARIALLRGDEAAAIGYLRRGLAFDSSDASAVAMANQLAARVRR